MKKLFWRTLSNLYKYYYRIKRLIVRPEMKIHNGLKPVTHAQQKALQASYQALLLQGKSPRETRRIIEKKLRIKVITGDQNL
jgi:hypothetical protein